MERNFSMKPSLYLAGPITGSSWEEITEWRDRVTFALGENITCLSPLRNKEYLSNETHVCDCYDEHLMSTQRAIFTRDMFDVERTTGLFINLLNAKRVSIGTVMEISYAWSLRHPIITVMEKNNIHQHSMLREASSWVVETLDDGIEVARRLFL